MMSDRNPTTGLPEDAKPRPRTPDEATHQMTMDLYNGARRNPLMAAAIIRAAAAIISESALNTGNVDADIAVRVIRDEVAENIQMNLDRLKPQHKGGSA